MVQAIREVHHANGFVEIETPNPHQEHAGGRPRLHRAVTSPARQRLRPAPESAAAQAAADGRRDRSLLPDRPLFPRRGPPWRPAAGVQPARPRDELRRRGRGHGLRRDDGDRGLAGDDAGPAAPRGPVPALHLRRGDGPVRVRQARPAVRDGARRPRPTTRRGRRVAGVRFPRLRRHARVGRPRQGDRRPRHGWREPARDRRANGAREAVRSEGPGPPRDGGKRRAEGSDRQVPRR